MPKRKSVTHSKLCARKGCRECLHLKALDDDLHPSNLPKREPYVYEGREDELLEAILPTASAEQTQS